MTQEEILRHFGMRPEAGPGEPDIRGKTVNEIRALYGLPSLGPRGDVKPGEEYTPLTPEETSTAFRLLGLTPGAEVTEAELRDALEGYDPEKEAAEQERAAEQEQAEQDRIKRLAYEYGDISEAEYLSYLGGRIAVLGRYSPAGARLFRQQQAILNRRGTTITDVSEVVSEAEAELTSPTVGPGAAPASSVGVGTDRCVDPAGGQAADVHGLSVCRWSPRLVRRRSTSGWSRQSRRSRLRRR